MASNLGPPKRLPKEKRRKEFKTKEEKTIKKHVKKKLRRSEEEVKRRLDSLTSFSTLMSSLKISALGASSTIGEANPTWLAIQVHHGHLAPQLPGSPGWAKPHAPELTMKLSARNAANSIALRFGEGKDCHLSMRLE